MAQVFISYSKEDAEPTVALARTLEAAGITVWWDTSLLPDDPHFPETIRREITRASAAIVIWTPTSVKSRWVYAEAKTADEQNKLIQLRTSSVNQVAVPLPFNTGQIGLVTELDRLFQALQRKDVRPNKDIGGLPNTWLAVRTRIVPSVSAIRSLTPTEMFYFDESTQTWDRDFGICGYLAEGIDHDAPGPVRVPSARSPEFLCVANLSGVTCIEYWKISSFRSAILDPPRGHMAQTSDGGTYTIQRLRIQREEFFFANGQYFMDVIGSVTSRRYGMRFWNAWNTVIEVGGREHVVLMGLRPNSATAAGDVIAEHKVRGHAT
jgi:hypothetical protein